MIAIYEKVGEFFLSKMVNDNNLQTKHGSFFSKAKLSMTIIYKQNWEFF
jgi:hypothetical protein